MLQPMLNRKTRNTTILNKRWEITGKCRHKNKFKLNKLPT